MRVIFLNCWHGELLQPLLDFLKNESSKTDVFGLLEVSPQILPKVCQALDGFWYGFAQNGPKSGQVIFVSERIPRAKVEKIDLYEQTPGDTGCLQKVHLNLNGKKLAIGSVHGKALPGDKFDNQIRLAQSEKIIQSFFQETLTIIGGDFNLLPETKSIKMFTEAGYRDLIKEFGVKTTRNRHAWEQAERQAKEGGKKFFGRQYFADYCFVSPSIKVKNFAVPNIEISDHLPLILDFEV